MVLAKQSGEKPCAYLGEAFNATLESLITGALHP
jgi:hypothetical protein